MDVRTHPVCDPETFERNLQAEGSRFSLVNGNFYLAGGHDDDTSVLGHPEQGWGWLVNGVSENDVFEIVPYAD